MTGTKALGVVGDEISLPTLILQKQIYGSNSQQSCHHGWLASMQLRDTNEPSLRRVV